jgi:shikimate kinase
VARIDVSDTLPAPRRRDALPHTGSCGSIPDMNPAPNLFLVGPMGAGKSTIGRALAAALELPFVDLDHEIEQRTGASIALIFDLEGEAGFRVRECTLLRELAAGEGIVLATGGGAVLNAESRQVLRERGFVVWLGADVDTQLSRLAHDRKRPLLATPDRRRKLQELARERDPLYAEVADLHLPSTGRGHGAQLVVDLVEQLQTAWQRTPQEASA